MSEQSRGSAWRRPLRFFGNVGGVFASAGRLGEALVQRTLSQWRAAALRPSPPLVQVAPGVTVGMPSGPDSPAVRDWPVHGTQSLSPLTRQRVQTYLLALPTWLPRPEQRRHGQGQVMLEWAGDHSRRCSVLIGPDDMLLYSARLGARGRFDGAEPFAPRLSPVILYALQQLWD